MAPSKASGADSTPKCPLQYRREPPKANAYDKIVTVQFEEKTESYAVHKGLISYFSDYFRGAFSGRFEEGKSGIITLPAEDLEGFQIFFGWMYTGRFDSPAVDDSKVSLPAAYIFAEKRRIPGLKNALIDCFVADKELGDKGLEQTTPFDYTILWDNTPDQDGFRKLVVDIFILLKVPDFVWDDETLMDALLREAMVQILRRIGPDRKRPAYKNVEWLKSRKCDYHDHRDLLGKGATAKKIVREAVDN